MGYPRLGICLQRSCLLPSALSVLWIEQPIRWWRCLCLCSGVGEFWASAMEFLVFCWELALGAFGLVRLCSVALGLFGLEADARRGGRPAPFPRKFFFRAGSGSISSVLLEIVRFEGSFLAHFGMVFAVLTGIWGRFWDSFGRVWSGFRRRPGRLRVDVAGMMGAPLGGVDTEQVYCAIGRCQGGARLIPGLIRYCFGRASDFRNRKRAT